MNTPGVDHNWFVNPVMEQLVDDVRVLLEVHRLLRDHLHRGHGLDPAGDLRGRHGSTARADGRRTGASPFPLLRPTVVLVSIMSMLQCLKTFSTQYLFTLAGAPESPINVITLSIYKTGIRDHRIGRASAMSIILLIIMVVLTWIQLKSTRSEDVSY